MTSAKEEIWTRKYNLDLVRKETMAELIKKYDETVYFPALRDLQESCALVGHQPTGSLLVDYDGSWYHYCNNCRAKLISAK